MDKTKKKEGSVPPVRDCGTEERTALSGRSAVGRQRRVYARTLLGGVRGVERAADARCKPGFGGRSRHDSLGLDRLLRAYRRTGAVVRRPDVLARGGIPHSVRVARPAVRTHRKLSLGYLNNTSTGAIKKTMEQNIEKIEGFIAHTIPDLVNVVATVVVMLVIFFSLDTWLTVVCLAVVLVSFALQFSNFMGKKAREFMSIYYDAQEKMSASAVQYVRGMPVVKIFGQSVRSFRQFNAEIQAYKTFALKCCDTYQNGMIAFTVLLNSMVTFILPVGILLIQGNPQSLALATVWLFFIIMGPGVASPIYKLTFLGGNTKEIDEGVARIDRILEKKPVPEPERPEVPQSYEVEFRHVSFSYENTEQGTRTEAAARCLLYGAARPDYSARGAFGKRQVHRRESDSPFLGRGAGRGAHRRREHQEHCYAAVDGYRFIRLSGYFPVL